MKKSLTLLFVLLFIAGCGVQNLPAMPTATAPLRVELTPSTTIWSGALNRCGQLNSDLNVMVDVNTTNQIPPGEDSLMIRSGEMETEYQQFHLADEEIVIIVNPNNPLNELTIDQLVSIYTGFSNTWGSVDPTQSTELSGSEITVYHYSIDDDLEKIFRTTDGTTFITTLSAKSVISPTDVIDRVGTKPEAIGFIPKSWLVSSVKQVKIDKKITYPLLMLTKNEPGGRLKQLMLCLQDQAKRIQ